MQVSLRFTFVTNTRQAPLHRFGLPAQTDRRVIAEPQSQDSLARVGAISDSRPCQISLDLGGAFSANQLAAAETPAGSQRDSDFDRDHEHAQPAKPSVAAVEPFTARIIVRATNSVNIMTFSALV